MIARTPLAVAAFAVAAYYGLPLFTASNPAVEPKGATNPDVTDANIAYNICIRGWTATVRPPKSYTDDLKRRQLPLGARMGDYEEDHFIPLELGGSPSNPANLWPEPWHGRCNAHDKDLVENVLHKKVCEGRFTLSQAQSMMHGWQGVYAAITGHPC